MPLPLFSRNPRRPSSATLAGFFLLVGLTGLSGLAGCGGGPDPDAATPAADAPLRLGATMSLTGAYATQGVPAANGYRLCVDHLNQEGGLLGRPVDLTLLDDASSTSIVAERYEAFLSEGEAQMDAILGPYGSTLTEALAPVTERHQAVHLSPLAATTSIWEQGRRYLFMVLPPAELFLAGLIEMAADDGLTRVAVLEEDALFPRAAGAGAAALATERGMQVVMRATYPSGTTDFGPFLEELRDSGAEVLAMAASDLDGFIRVREQLPGSGAEPRLFGTSGAVAEFQAALGDRAEGVYGLSAWEPSLPNPGNAEFVAAFEAAFGQAPSFHAAGAYGTCRLLAMAAERAGTLESEALRSELLALETTTVFGPYAVDERGYQVANQGVFIQWQDGEKAVVWPPELATAPRR